MDQTVISVKKLVKKYGPLTAVDGISFDVDKGEIFGLLGENGAGKTTTLEIIESLRKPTSGEVIILGHNLSEHATIIKEKIGVQLQSSAYFGFLSLTEILDLFGSFYPHHLDSKTLLDMVGLSSKADSFVNKLSGGQKQRFSIVASLVNDPEIVFLDEPTTGLDPIARRNLWELISQIKAQGKTIMLTTHYMEEAEMLCDHIAIMDSGSIIASDKTHRLIEKAPHPFKINFVAHEIKPAKLDKIAAHGKLQEMGGKSNHYELTLKTKPQLNEALKLIQAEDPDSFTVSQASLEDVFIELTGKTIKE